MIYSVPTGDNGYTYYEGTGGFPPTGRYREPEGVAVHGMYPPEAFAKDMPPRARRVGSGQRALGIMARRTGGSFLGALEAPLRSVAVDVCMALVISWVFRKRR